jgi:hypothetical protein
MIIANLTGGLGNQLFQYCCARAVAELRRTQLKLDCSELTRDQNRSYSLGAWNVAERFASSADLIALRIRHRIDSAVHPRKPFYRRYLVVEQDLRFDRRILEDSPPSCLLVGYWQTEQYFTPIENIIRSELTLRRVVSEESARVADAIKRTDSVFVHIRRGDYVRDAQTQATHGSCSPAYYAAAARYVLERAADAHFFVFSDEPEWAKANLRLGGPMTVVDHNKPGDAHQPGQEHEDMWLMAQCRHAIIANSSFSWWGAWLNPERDRIVIAPSSWTTTPKYESPDRLPGRWITLEM